MLSKDRKQSSVFRVQRSEFRVQIKKCLRIILSSDFCLLTSVFLGVAALAISGCGKIKEPGKTSGAKTLLVWHWMTDRDEAFQDLAEQYQQETGMNVQFELYAPSESYMQKVRAAAQTNTLPDLFGILGESRDFASFIKAGHVFNLTSSMKADNSVWERRFFPKALATDAFAVGNEYGVQPGIYGVPIDVTTIQLLYNKDLFKKAGLDPEWHPETWDDFIALGPKFRKIGVPGFVSGWGELWLIDCFASNLAFNVMGKDKVFATYKGEVPYTDPAWIKVFNCFSQLSQSNLMAPGVVTMVNKTAEQTFANGRAAMTFNGSWGVNVYKGMSPDLKYAAFLPPKVVASNSPSVWGGAGSSFVINAHSKNKEEAVKFLNWLTETAQQVDLSSETVNLPAVADALGELDPVLAQFGYAMNFATHPSQFPVRELSSVVEAFDKGIQSILIGEKTPVQVANEVQKFKEAEMSKLKMTQKTQ